MKKLILRSSGILGLALALALPAQADLINGSIGFTGDFTPVFAPGADTSSLANVIAVNFGDAVTAGNFSGDYAGIAEGVVATFHSSGNPLWSFSSGDGVYQFFATSMTIATNPFSVTAWGSGIATITGIGNYDATPGLWVVTLNGLGANATFSSSASVPDSAATVAMLGFGLLALAIVRRRSTS